jgi:NDP-sugar pyrophosphorylase family protein
MINWIFPIAGKGTRTKQHGKYKPFIDIAGKTMIERCIDNLRSKFCADDEFYFITTKAFEEEFQVTRTLRMLLFEYKVKVIVVPETPPGQAYSVKWAADSICLNNNNACIIVNSDQLTLFDLPDTIGKNDVLMPLYFTNSGKSCYVELDSTWTCIVRIKEKELISCYASSGTFIFGSANLLYECITWGINHEEEISKNGELFLGPCINYISSAFKQWWSNPEHSGIPAHIIPLTTYMKIDLGTDEQIEKYLTYLKTLRINSFSNYESVGHYE